jgi:NAD(P)H-dependent FMN reductase
MARPAGAIRSIRACIFAAAADCSLISGRANRAPLPSRAFGASFSGDSCEEGRPVTLRLHIIVASTRPGRVGIAVGRWFHGFAREHGAGFDAHLVDLAEVGLPLLDEPKHPRLRDYQHAHTHAWSESVDAADAFVFVTPEYNHSPTPALLNALDYLLHEWAHKPAGFVSYGGISGGLRAVQATKTTLACLRVVPVLAAVTIPHVAQQVEDGVFTPKEVQEQGAKAMLAELARWGEALRPMRG